jgi:hypothetical protein
VARESDRVVALSALVEDGGAELTPPSAAAVRASVERSDLLSSFVPLAMRPKVYASGSVGTPGTVTPAARAHGPVADDPGRITADPTASDTDSHREDSAAMEHERQARLARWQRQGDKLSHKT